MTAPLDVAKAWSAAKRYPVFVGEFGAYSKADEASRIDFNRTMRAGDGVARDDAGRTGSSRRVSACTIRRSSRSGRDCWTRCWAGEQCRVQRRAIVSPSSVRAARRSVASWTPSCRAASASRGVPRCRPAETPAGHELTRAAPAAHAGRRARRGGDRRARTARGLAARGRERARSRGGDRHARGRNECVGDLAGRLRAVRRPVGVRLLVPVGVAMAIPQRDA